MAKVVRRAKDVRRIAVFVDFTFVIIIFRSPDIFI